MSKIEQKDILSESLSESIIYVLKKMCSYVNVDYNTVDFSKNKWYFDYEWTIDDEEDFISWLSNEIKINNKVRKGITTLSYRPSKLKCKKVANEFNMMYGWKLK